MNTRINKMNSWFISKNAASADEVRALNADSRTDEAVHARIRMNIFGIFQTVLSVAGDDDEIAGEFFLTRLEQIPKSWHTSLLAAEAHGDTEKAHIEHLKLDAVAEIREAFARIWEVKT